MKKKLLLIFHNAFHFTLQDRLLEDWNRKRKIHVTLLYLNTNRIHPNWIEALKNTQQLSTRQREERCAHEHACTTTHTHAQPFYLRDRENKHPACSSSRCQLFCQLITGISMTKLPDLRIWFSVHHTDYTTSWHGLKGFFCNCMLQIL